MIIVRIYEGLGNQLFQYAYARTLSLSSDHEVLLDVRETGRLKKEKGMMPRKYGLKNFRIALPVCSNAGTLYPYLNKPKTAACMKKLSEWGILPYKYFSESDPFYDEHLLDLKGNWYLQGWFQDSRYFQEYAGIIKKEIVPKKRIKINSKLKKILYSENTVSVHLRRSDFSQMHNILTETYYRNAMDYMKDAVASPFWVVFSDDIGWAKKNIDFGLNCYYLSDSEGLEDYEELMVMSCCMNHIIANSTYSWWGAWLGRNESKIIVGPEKWFMGDYISLYRRNSIMPKEWIRVSVR